jgi:peptidoglycan-N-acetylglucosamine deacetylase
MLAWVVYIGAPALIGYGLRVAYSLRLRRSSALEFLTFDDGPSPVSTSALLRVLERAGCTAAFFVQGRNAERHPDTVLKILRCGHRIGEHGYDHCHPWTTGPIRMTCDLIRSARVMKTFVSGDEQVLFRPPYGKVNLAILVYVLVMRRRLILWTVNPRDYRSIEFDDLITRIVDGLKNRRIVKGSQVLLLHSSPRRLAGRRNGTASIVAMVLRKLEQEGIRFAPISVLLERAVSRRASLRRGAPPQR